MRLAGAALLLALALAGCAILYQSPVTYAPGTQGTVRPKATAAPAIRAMIDYTELYPREPVEPPDP